MPPNISVGTLGGGTAAMGGACIIPSNMPSPLPYAAIGFSRRDVHTSFGDAEGDP
jgi:hypothetical protein